MSSFGHAGIFTTKIILESKFLSAGMLFKNTFKNGLRTKMEA